eukprot:m.484610 g.484610  ORF g.484610 m.484610 type:complete len:308 (+) comp23453_c0_seq1:210-1133(+)
MPPKKQRRYRKRTAIQEMEDQPDAPDVDEGTILSETAEAQKLRKRPKGVSAVGLAIGQKVSTEEEAELGWSLEKGGLMPVDLVKNKKKKEEEEQEDIVTQALQSTFAHESKTANTEQDVDKYVEEQLAKSRSAPEERDTRSEYEKLEASLYQVPERLQKGANMEISDIDRGMFSNTILSGIPEVDLGADSKITNIEKTEEMRLALQGGKRTGTKKKFLNPMNTNENYARARFAIGQGEASTSGQQHLAEFERAKKRAFETGTVDSARYTALPPDISQRQYDPRYSKKNMASDDLAFAKFRKHNFRRR